MFHRLSTSSRTGVRIKYGLLIPAPLAHTGAHNGTRPPDHATRSFMLAASSVSAAHPSLYRAFSTVSVTRAQSRISTSEIAVALWMRHSTIRCMATTHHSPTVSASSSASSSSSPPSSSPSPDSSTVTSRQRHEQLSLRSTPPPLPGRRVVSASNKSVTAPPRAPRSHSSSIAAWEKVYHWHGWDRAVVGGIIALNLAVFLAWETAKTKREQGSSAMEDWMNRHMTVTADNIVAGRFHTLVTAAFSHQEWESFVLNMLLISFTGFPLARAMGALPFLGFYLGAAEAGWSAFLLWRTDAFQRMKSKLFGSSPTPVTTSQPATPSPSSTSISASASASASSTAFTSTSQLVSPIGLGASGAACGLLSLFALANTRRINNIRLGRAIQLPIPTGVRTSP